MTSKAEERLIKARIKLQEISPFFSYLSLFLKFKEAPKMIDERFTASINPKGVMYYYPKWIERLSDKEIIGVLCHEIMHLALLHLIRGKKKENIKWNIATDLCINGMLLNNRFELPKGALLPEHDKWDIPTQWIIYDLARNKSKKDLSKLNTKLMKRIENISQKTAEEIYNDLPDIPKEIIINFPEMTGWDKHLDDDESKELSESEINEIENDWLNRVEEAYIDSKQKGNIPLGIERYIDQLKKSQIDWKTLLQKYLLALIKNDYTWMKRSRKSYATGIYLPDVGGEKIEIIVGIDTSGSISQEELKEFITEIVGISKAYKDKLDIRIMCHDINVQTDLEIKNANVEKIKKIKIKGGGGTSHIPLFNKIKERYKDSKILICFTDGYSNLNQINFKDYGFSKIFIISKNGDDNSLIKRKGECITIKIK